MTNVNEQIMIDTNFALCGRTKNTNYSEFTHSTKSDIAEQIYVRLRDDYQIC